MSGMGGAWEAYKRRWLERVRTGELGVDEATAARDACKIEHDISDETFEALKRVAREYRPA